MSYDDEDALVSALKGQQFLIITLSVTAAHDTQSKFIQAAARAGVPYVMPNSYGWDVLNEGFAADIPLSGGSFKLVRTEIEAAGVSSWIALVCGFWYEFSLVNGEPWFGFDFKEKKVTFFDNGETKINVSTWEQCGRAVARLLSLKELPDDENDKEPALSNWRNKPVYIDSFEVSQRDMYESWKRITGDTDEDWTRATEPVTERYARGLELLKKGDRSGLALAMYSRVFYPNGDGNHGQRYGLVNDLLGLPKEDLDARTVVAKDLLDRGYSYFGNRL